MMASTVEMASTVCETEVSRVGLVTFVLCVAKSHQTDW